jgi:hypothetical protein
LNDQEWDIADQDRKYLTTSSSEKNETMWTHTHTHTHIHTHSQKCFVLLVNFLGINTSIQSNFKLRIDNMCEDGKNSRKSVNTALGKSV